ncbi:MAG: orotidine-5'-phosphate decarboxylase [Candidatus Omnitrophica bacterium]|nr:orotidine-5'-phosphate decarboxylase [Candidatus Omnitrophota bacterium]
MANLWQRLVVALDLDSEKKIKEIINNLSPQVTKFKIGPVAFMRFGPQVVNWAKDKGADIFLDFKLYDIPNTMVEAAKALVDLDVWSFTVHLKAGCQSISVLTKQTERYAKEKQKRVPLIFGVTELTSQQASLEEVLKLAKIGKESGVSGIVCSVWEAERIKAETGLLMVTPGIRPSYAKAPEGKQKQTADDQKRTATLGEAIKAGSDYFVVGRPIVKSDNPKESAKSLIESVL